MNVMKKPVKKPKPLTVQLFHNRFRAEKLDNNTLIFLSKVKNRESILEYAKKLKELFWEANEYTRDEPLKPGVYMIEHSSKNPFIKSKLVAKKVNYVTLKTKFDLPYRRTLIDEKIYEPVYIDDDDGTVYLVETNSDKRIIGREKIGEVVLYSSECDHEMLRYYYYFEEPEKMLEHRWKCCSTTLGNSIFGIIFDLLIDFLYISKDEMLSALKKYRKLQYRNFTFEYKNGSILLKKDNIAVKLRKSDFPITPREDSLERIFNEEFSKQYRIDSCDEIYGETKKLFIAAGRYMGDPCIMLLTDKKLPEGVIKLKRTKSIEDAREIKKIIYRHVLRKCDITTDKKIDEIIDRFEEITELYEMIDAI